MQPDYRGPRGHSGHRRVLLVGSGSVVARALQLFLRKEGYDARMVSDDPATWTKDLAAQPRLLPVQLVIIAPSMPEGRRHALCRRLREDSRTRGVPILALLDAGDGQATRAGSDAARGEVDALVAWPFRLREVLVAVDGLVASPSGSPAGTVPA